MQTPSTVLVTGVGSMPGTDSAEAARIVAGEFDVPHLVELPARGPGADMIGRTLALVSAATGEFAAETTTDGWRLAGVRAGGDLGRQMRRGSAWLGEDADRLEDALQGFAGTLKVQVVGPWSLAAGVETVRGTRLLADAGACADLAAALCDAVAGHVADLARRVPAARVVVQFDEPTLPAVRAGHLRTASGRGAVRAPQDPELVGALAAVAGAARGAGAVFAIAHCCARQVPFDLFARAGIEAVSIDSLLLGSRADEDLGAWWDRGGVVVLGEAPAVDTAGLGAEAVARTVEARWRRIGFGMADVGQRTWLSPTCGMAGASPAWARSTGGVLRATARLLDSAE